MPELPEVETVMRGMAARLQGHVLTRVDVNRADLRRPFPPDLARRLTGARVCGFRRRAKYILMRLDNGVSMLLHLGMSGRISITQGAPPVPVAHEHLVMTTDDGWRIALVDPRRFGLVDLVPTDQEDLHPLLCGIGPEPLDPVFTSTCLAQALDHRRTPIKAALLDQKIVAGLGNIYVCEALFRAAIAPQREASTLQRPEVARLTAAIKTVLEDAVAAGGSSLRDYAQPNGELGYFQHAWKVYGHQGDPCPFCPGPPKCHGITRIVQSGRSTFYCAQRQH